MWLLKGLPPICQDVRKHSDEPIILRMCQWWIKLFSYLPLYLVLPIFLILKLRVVCIASVCIPCDILTNRTLRLCNANKKSRILNKVRIYDQWYILGKFEHCSFVDIHRLLSASLYSIYTKPNFPLVSQLLCIYITYQLSGLYVCCFHSRKTYPVCFNSRPTF